MTVSRFVSFVDRTGNPRRVRFDLKHYGLLVLVASSLFITGCASSSKRDAEAKPLTSKVEPLNELMSRAQAAEAVEGGRERARLLYRDAAKAYPTDKRPWARLAQSYFDASDYGNAILAAQEVVLRDSNDSVAQGVLAVSGLRVSTAALSVLRSQNGLSTSTRSEAEDMARNLRSVLGENVLVPKPAEAVPEAEAKSQPTTRPRKPVRSAPRPSVATNPAAPKAPAAPAPSANPFGALQ